MDETLLKKLEEAVLQNLNNEQFSVEDLADHVAMSRSHLHRKLIKLTGQSSTQYIKNIRLDHAYEYLSKNIGTVSEIAFKVGFGSSTYFIKCFSEKYGFSPGEVRKGKIADKPEPTTNSTQEESSKPGPSSIEMLHPAAAESMIQEIFQAMIKHKPSLAKFMMVDEDEGETVDNRLLAYQIFKIFPWPIGIEVRRLFSINLSSGHETRFEQLQRTIKRCLKVLTFILLGELINRIQLLQLKLDANQGKKLADRLQNLNEDNLLQSLETLTQLVAQPSDFFEDDLVQTFDDAFFREVSDWTSLIQNTENLAETCENLEQILTYLLKKSTFLLKYKMVSINSIEVVKPKYKEATFQHSLHILNNVDGEFQIHQEVLEAFADSRAVLLMKSIKNSREYINLSPLIIDTHHVKVDQPNRSIVKDVFLFESFEDQKLSYAGTAVANTVNLSNLENYDALCEEYQETINLLTR